MRDQSKEIINIDFELLIELLNSTDHVCQNVSSTVKSLMKLGFFFLFKNNYSKFLEILQDTIKFIKKIDSYDMVYLSKLIQMTDKLKSKIKEKKEIKKLGVVKKKLSDKKSESSYFNNDNYKKNKKNNEKKNKNKN